jgi:toxin FitB
MMYVLDTNVISEIRKSRPHGAVIAWIRGVPDVQLFLSAITIAELQRGAEKTRVQDPGKAAELDTWIDGLLQTFKVLPLDAEIAREWARLMHGKSRDLSEDAMIGATARLRHLTVVTRNVTDFALLGIPTLNPFTATSAD